MGLKDDISDYIDAVIKDSYNISDAYAVPSRSSLTFGASAKKLWARVVYMDIRRSRSLMANHSKLMSLRAHKAFLYSVAKCMRAEDGEPRSFNGDSLLCFFKGDADSVAKRAVRAAMKSRWAIDRLINPVLQKKYGRSLDYGIGVGQGEIYVGKSGLSGDTDFQDLIWIGWPVYHAVAFGEEASKPDALLISENVWKSIKNDRSMTYAGLKPMWRKALIKIPSGVVPVYKTPYRWPLI